jgi:hypothetical protein
VWMRSLFKSTQHFDQPVSNSKPILKEMGETIDEMSNHIQSYAHDLGRVFRSLYRMVQACTPISNMA